ncbi:hypothetical protein [Lactobacillus delbrueckii]|uniref:hypothetical protein n=1 Tax=Lactobacillus delbrueckii TaxID=1584 RepID=UPI001E4FD3FA|nr:hypothetical protein [Lactobacillus delbrueckii]MCD5485140.1 hypothetical protein [Lactobacillus delbrueckii subsp. lactis]
MEQVLKIQRAFLLSVLERLLVMEITLLTRNTIRARSINPRKEFGKEARLFSSFLPALNANFPGFYNSMSKKPTITAFFEV